MTEEIALVDAYERECEATVIRVGGDGLILDRTVFYARGGGQPGDSGKVHGPSGRVAVADTVRVGGRPLHVLAAPTDLGVGETITARVDWDRRYLLMRTHTALHVLSAVIWRDFDAKVTGGSMEPGTARMDFELEGISVALGREVEDRVNRELAEAHEVEVHFVARDEALADPDLIRTKVSLIPSHIDPIRVVQIGSLDRQADGGTHVASTSEVGVVRVVKTESKGAGNKRMRIELDG